MRVSVRESDLDCDVILIFLQREDAFDFAELGTARERLFEAEGVEAFADRHRAERLAHAYADLERAVRGAAAVRELRAGFLQHHIAAFTFDDRGDRIAQSVERFARKTAGAGLLARKVALVEQEHACTGGGKVIGSSAARGTCPRNQNVVVERHENQFNRRGRVRDVERHFCVSLAGKSVRVNDGMNEQFDAVVIGSGQGGNPLAKAMAKHGWKTAVVERRYAGGTCVNDGCTPTKTMVASAKVAEQARRAAEYGVQCGAATIDMARVYARKQEIVLGGRNGNAKGLEEAGCALIYGEGSFAEEQPGGGSYAIDVRAEDGSVRQLVTSRVFLDTGERPHVPELDGLEKVPYLDSTSILEIQTVPEHLLVLGGGYIALEFAQMFRRFGSRVTVVEHGARIAAHEDDDIADCMAEILREDGIDILTNAKAVRVSGDAGSVSLDVEVSDAGKSLHGTHLLLATGRTPNTDALKLELVGVKLDEHGYVQVNDRLETRVPGIWALGDVKGGPAFTHISYDDFRILRANLLEGGSCSTKDRLLPYCMFIDPELGRVGMSEKQARAAGRDVRVTVMPAKRVARANEMAETRGMWKAIVDRSSGEILGAAILGVNGGEVVTQIQMAMMGGLKYTRLRECVFIHPALGEGLNVLFDSFQE